MTKKIDWDKQPLGEMPDRELAETLGIGWRTVIRARTRRNIPSFQQTRREKRLEKLTDELLRTTPNYRLIKEFSYTWKDIQEARKNRGIPSPGARPRYGGPKVASIPSHIRARLGVDPDGDIAKELGVHFSTVRYWRLKLGIPAFNEKQRSKNLSKKELEPLLRSGLLDDRTLAIALGTCEEKIAEHRRELRIFKNKVSDHCQCGTLLQGNQQYFCSSQCSTRVRNAVSSCRLPPRPIGHYAPIHKLLWAFSKLSKNCWERTRHNYHGLQIQEQDHPQRNADNHKGKQRRKTRRTAA